MEYCIDVLIETFEPGPSFRLPQPVQTAWGEAWRTEEYGRFFWRGGLFVRRGLPQPWLIARLPPSLQAVDWRVLSVGDQGGLRDFEARVNGPSEMDGGEADDEDSLRRHPLPTLLEELLAGQRRWAVFFLYNCDQIDRDYRRPLSGLAELVIEAYRWNSEGHQGFCCSSGD